MRSFADCKQCANKRTKHCITCTSGENFEPEAEELDFDNPTFGEDDEQDD